MRVRSVFTVTNVLATVFVVVSLSKMLARQVDNNEVARIATALTIAPAPNPFRAVQKSKFRQDRGLAFGCENERGELVWRRFDYSVRNRLAGPHRRTAVFLHLSEKVNNPRLASPRDVKEYLQYAMCNGGPMAEVIGCRGDITEYRLRRKADDDNERAIKCRS